MHYYHSVNDEKLKRHISLYKKLHRGDFSQSIYDAQLELNERIERVIVSFETGALKLDPSQYALFAKYIAVVSPHQLQRESLFDKLQKLADFDVRAEAKRANLSWFQRTFNIDPDKVPYLSSSKLRKRMHSYCHNARSPLVSRKRYEKNEELAHEAQKYMQSFLDGKVKIKPEDRETFRKFIKVFEYPLYDGCLGQQCLDKLKTLPDEPVVEKKSLRESFSAWISKFKAPKLPKLNINKPKISAPKLSKKHQSYLKAASAALIAVAGGALVYMGFNNNQKEADRADNTKDKTETSAEPQKSQTAKARSDTKGRVLTWDEALKKNEFKSQPASLKETKMAVAQTKTVSQPQQTKLKQETAPKKSVTVTPKTEQKAVNSAPKAEQKVINPASKTEQKVVNPAPKAEQKVVNPAPKAEQKVVNPTTKTEQKVVNPTPKTVKPTSVINTKELTTSEKQAIIDHHSFVVEMRLGKTAARELNKKIETLRDKENAILELPENISNAEIAYAFVMYRAYGVQSSLKDALNSKVKLTAEQNKKVQEDIMAVGSVGEGVKKLAEIQHNGNLSDNSCYNNASVTKKKIHAKNLKALRQIQKAKQRAA